MWTIFILKPTISSCIFMIITNDFCTINAVRCVPKQSSGYSASLTIYRYWNHVQYLRRVSKKVMQKYPRTFELAKWRYVATRKRESAIKPHKFLGHNCPLNISMAWSKKDVTPLLTHWSYVFLALTHRYDYQELGRHVSPALKCVRL